jgi:hypothetical protein
MNWRDAVEVMKLGHAVRMASESRRTLIQPADDNGNIPIYESGLEGCRLMHAWTADEKPALVFMGSMSKCLFVPEHEHRVATDWEIEK